MLMLNMTLRQRLTFSMLYCRLTCQSPSGEGDVIREKATQILMYYVPQVNLLVNADVSEGVQTWPAAGKGGAKVEVTEGQRVEFLCNVRAKPPSYNITWLRNGHHVTPSKKRITAQDSTLTLSEVKRRDDGLYTCLASNTEGDGQSNAVLLRVRFAPRCSVSREAQLIAPRSLPLFLECSFEAEPSNVTFTWRRMDVTSDTSSSKSLRNYHNGHGGIITGDTSSTPAVPKYIDLTPLKEEDPEEEEKEIKPPAVHGPPLEFQRDPKMPTRSFLKVVPENDPEGYVCFAKNRVGHSKIPCIFTLVVIDPPPPPEGCHVEAISVSSLKVRCQSVPQKEKPLVSHHSPDISPVRALETRTSTILEVWAMGTLVANLSSEKALWDVEKLTPDTDLRLRIYSTSLKTHSMPVVLIARTKNPYAGESSTSTEKDPTYVGGTESDTWADEGHLNTWILIGVGLGLFSLVVLCILGWAFIISIIHKRKSRYDRRQTDSNGFSDNWSERSSSSQQQQATNPPGIQMLENPLTTQLQSAVS